MPRTSQTSRSTPRRSDRKLSEVARHVLIPTGITMTAWPAVEARCAEFGDSFDEWQRGAGKIILGKRENGEYAATVGGITLSIPRQVAKTFLISRIIFALCTLHPGLTVLWTAHRTRTATKTFQTLRGFALKRTVAPFMHPTSPVRSTNGEQELHFANGSVIMFGAREGGFGRGFDEVDIEVFDEAQILTEKALEDMVAATNQSRFPAGALLFFMGTPPRPVDPGEEFKRRRRDALAILAALERGDDVECDEVYIECSADPDADPNDRKQWAIANPSYPHRTPLRSMLRLRKNLKSDASWKREALGIWDSDQEGSRLITATQWRDTAVGSVPDDGLRCFGVAFSQDGSRVSLAGALRHTDATHLELIDAHTGDLEAGVGPLADWLAARWRRTGWIAISGRAGSAALVSALRERGVPASVIHVMTTTEVYAACAMTYDAVKAKTATHPVAPEGDVLDASIAVSDRKKRAADGAWAWTATTDDGDETPTEAISFAYWAARTTKRRPGRKQVVV